MSIRPVDMKTALLTADNASKIREDQKNQEAGLSQQVTQNRHSQETKVETVQTAEGAEGKLIRKEDEEEQNKGKALKTKVKKKSDDESEKPQIQLPDGIHGNFDLRA